MPYPWGKLHVAIIDDEKLRDFSGDEYRIWTFLILLASENERERGTVPGDADAIAWRTRQPVALVAGTLAKCETRGMIAIVAEPAGVRLTNFARWNRAKPSDAREAARARQPKVGERARLSAI